jgi:hypothetical protein
MRLTRENKGWMRDALYLGRDNMEIFDGRWEWISEPFIDLAFKEQCMFFQAYVKFGGDPDPSKGYDTHSEAFKQTYEYAQDKIYEAFCEIEKRLNLEDEE